MEDRKPAKLRRLRVTRVDLVDRGSNPDADIVLFKRAREPDQNPGPKSVDAGGEPVSDTWLRRTLTAIAKSLNIDVAKSMAMLPNEMLEHEKAMNEFWSLKYALTRSIDSILESDKGMDEKMTMVTMAIGQFQDSCKALMPHVQMETDMYKVQGFLEDIDAAGTDVAKVSEVVKALVMPTDKQPGNTPPVNPPVKKKDGEVTVNTMEEILKSLSQEQRAVVETALAKNQDQPQIPAELAKRLAQFDEVAKNVEQLTKRAENAETNLQKAQVELERERELRVAREYMEKAAKYPSAGATEKVANILRKAYGVSDDYGQEIEATFAKNEQLSAQSELFKELGRGGQPKATSAEERLDKLATERFEKGLAKTKEQAYDEVLKMNPGLYAQSLNEKGGN